MMVPVIGGTINSSAGLFYNVDLAPPGSAYIATYYDTTKRAVSTTSLVFTVSSTPVTLPALTIVAPTSFGSSPTPDS